ncbi:ABC transporter substrate-binding protein [Endozoicomonas lisbonensis]|uniref:Multiple sugar transport system substrate-binding protein n=1 Tax=Endozoicomonas lisbonensis TaxID=3120522 RepID=A0ABV2SD40_9GAMM
MTFQRCKTFSYGLALGLTLTCAAGIAQARETVKFTVAEYSSKTDPYYQQLAKEFNASQSDHKVVVETVSWDDLQTRLTTDISAGTNSDLAIIGTRWLVGYVDEGIAAPLDKLLDKDIRERFIPAFLEPGTLDGKLYGVPVAASARAMFVNNDLLSQAGVSIPATLDEMEAAASKINALGKDIYGYGLQGNEIETDVYFYYTMWAEGGTLLSDDGSSNLASKASLKAAERIQRMIRSNSVQPSFLEDGREAVMNLFKTGRLGMVIAPPFMAKQLREEAPDVNWSIANIPAASSSATYGVTDSIVLFENSRNKQGAVEFIDFMYSTEKRAEFSAGEGFLPVLKAVGAKPEFAANPDVNTFVDMLPKARFAPTIAEWPEVASVTSDAIQAIYSGAPADKVLGKAEQRINRIIK